MIKTRDPHRAVLAVRTITYWDNNSPLTHFHGKWQSPPHSTIPTTKEIQEPREEITAGEHWADSSTKWMIDTITGLSLCFQSERKAAYKISTWWSCSSHLILDLILHCGSPTFKPSWRSWGHLWHFPSMKLPFQCLAHLSRTLLTGFLLHMFSAQPNYL